MKEDINPKLIKNLYNKYAPNVDVESKLEYIQDKYGDDEELFVRNFYNKYSPNVDVESKLEYIKTNYPKKKSTESSQSTSKEEVTEPVTKTKTVPTGSSDSSSQEPPKTTAVQRAFSKAPPAPKPEDYGSDIMGQGMYEKALSEWQAKYVPARLSAVSEAKDKLAQEERALQQVETDKQEALSNLEAQGKKDTSEYEAVASDFQKDLDERQTNVVEAEASIADTEDVFAATNKYMDSDDFKFEQDKLTKEKQEYLEGIDEDFIVDNTPFQVVNKLNDRYKDKGFSFVTDGKLITVMSEYDKKGLTLDLGVGEVFSDQGVVSDITSKVSPGISALGKVGRAIDYMTGERDQQRGVQLDLLRNFLFENQSITEGTSDEEMSELIETRPYAVSEEEYKKFNERTNAKVYRYKNKLNNIAESYDELSKVVQQQADELNNKYNVLLETVKKQGGATPEQLEEARNLETLFNTKGYITTEQQQQLEELKNSYNATQEELKNNIDISRDINLGVGASITQQIKRDEQLGTTTGALANKFLEGVEDIAAGAATFGIALVDMLDDIQNNQINNGIKLIYGDKADDTINSLDKDFKERSKDRKEAIVDSRNFLEGILVNNYGSSTTKEYTESDDRSGLMEVTMGVAQSLPAMITTAISGGAGFAAMGLQAFDGVAEEWVNNPEFENMPLRDLVIVGGSIGAIQGALEKAGFTALIGKSPLGKTLTNKILGSVMGKVTKKTTGAELSRIITAETNSLLKNGVIKIVGGALAEGETGALQEITDIGLKRIYNSTQGESVFGTPETLGGVVVQVGKGALMEAAGGALMKGALTAPRMVVDGVRGIGMKKDMFNALHFMSDSPELRGSMAKTLKMEILQGRMTKEQAQKTMQSFEEMISVMRQIPNSTAQKAKAFDLILEQNRLTKEKAGMNPALVKKTDERLKEIQAELLNSVEPEVKSEILKQENEKSELEGKEELDNLKEGSTTTTKPVRIFKGRDGKKDAYGRPINAHKGAEGVFSAVDKDLAAEYGRDTGVSEMVLPEGTTVEVIEIDTEGLGPDGYRAAEVKAINNSNAQVVKLITIDGVLKKGAKKQEQYVIKDKSLIEKLDLKQKSKGSSEEISSLDSNSRIRGKGENVEVVEEATVAEEAIEFEEGSGADITREDIEKAKAEEEANQVVYEMNKTDKKIWSKDFEILDNRQGQEEYSLDEDGDKLDNKWLVVNKVTGEVLYATSKKDAKNIVDSAPAYADLFGDGNTVQSENIITPSPAAEVTEEVVDEATVAEVTKEQQALTDEIAELENTYPSEVDTSIIIEDSELEISNVKEELKNDIAEKSEEIKKVRADKSLSKEERDERIEEIQEEKEDLREEAGMNISNYKEDIQEAKKERRAIDRKIKKLKTKLDAIPKQSTKKVDAQESTRDSKSVGEGDTQGDVTTQQKTAQETDTPKISEAEETEVALEKEANDVLSFFNKEAAKDLPPIQEAIKESNNKELSKDETIESLIELGYNQAQINEAFPQESKEFLDKVIEVARAGKLGGKGMTQSTIIPTFVWDAVLEGVAITAETIKAITDKIKDSDWYKNSNRRTRKAVDEELNKRAADLQANQTVAPQSNAEFLRQKIQEARDKGFSDRGIRKALTNPLGLKFTRKFSDAEIDAALEVTVADNIKMPKEFERVQGGVSQAIELFNNVRSKLKTFSKGKSKVQIQKKALALLKQDPIFKEQPAQIQEELIVGLESSIREEYDIQKGSRNIDAEIASLKNDIAVGKITEANIEEKQIQLRNFIRKNLPVSKEYTQGVINRLIDSLATTNVDTFKINLSNVLTEIETQRAKLKEKQIDTLIKQIKNNAKTTSSLDAKGKQLFKDILPIVQGIIKGDIDPLTNEGLPNNIKQDIDNLNLIESLIQKELDQSQREAEGKKVDDAEKITAGEQKLIHIHFALNEFKDINNLDLNALKELNKRIKSQAKVFRNNAIANSERRSQERKEQREKFTDQIKETNPLLFNENGDVETPTEMARKVGLVRALLKERKYGEAVTTFLKVFKYSDTKELITSFTKNLKHLGTLTNMLDRVSKTKTLFSEGIYDNLNKAENESLGYEQESMQKLDDLAKENGFKSYTDFLDVLAKLDRKKYKKDKKLFHLKGQSIKLRGQIYNTGYTSDDLARIYALSRNADQRQQLKDNNGIGEEQLKEIENILGKKITAFVDGTINFLTYENYEKVNEVYKKVNDVNLPQILNYFPTKKEASSKKPSFQEQDIVENSQDYSANFNAQTSPSFKERADKTLKINLQVGGFSTVLEQHLTSMGRYRAYAQPVQQINNIFKIPAVSSLMSSMKGMRTTFETLINNTVNPVTSSNVIQDSGLQKAQSAFTGLVLGYRAIQLAKQAASMVNGFKRYNLNKSGRSKLPGVVSLPVDLTMYTLELSKTILELSKDLAGFVIKDKKGNPIEGPIRKMMRISPTFKSRLQKNFKGELGSLESGGKSRSFNVSGEARRSRKNKRRDIARRASGFFTAAGDLLGVLGHVPAYNADIRSGMSQAEALKKFNDFNESEQSRRGTEKNLLQAKGGVQGFMLTAFGSTVYLQINSVMSSLTNILRDIKSGKQPRQEDVRNFALKYAVANVIFAAMGNIFKLTGEEEDEESFMQDLKMAMIGMNLLYRLPMLGFALQELDAGGRIINAAGNITKEEKDKVEYKRSEGAYRPSYVNVYSSLLRKRKKDVKKYGELLDNETYGEIAGNAKQIVDVLLKGRIDPFIALVKFISTSNDKELTDDELIENIGAIIGVGESSMPAEKKKKKKKAGKVSMNPDFSMGTKSAFKIDVNEGF